MMVGDGIIDGGAITNWLFSFGCNKLTEAKINITVVIIIEGRTRFLDILVLYQRCAIFW